MSSLSEVLAQFGQNSGYVEDLYRLYTTDPSLVGEGWASFFARLSDGQNGNGHHLPAQTLNHRGASSLPDAVNADLQSKVFQLVAAYREFGHFAANINPLHNGVRALPLVPELQASHYGFSAGDLALDVNCLGFRGRNSLPLGKLIEELKQCYCGTLGAEFSHIVDSNERVWWQTRIENRAQSLTYSPEQRRTLLARLIEAEGFESELHKTYVGSKRFSVQGAETALPMMQRVIDFAGTHAVSDVVIGMAHRGRLNVLAHIVGKPDAQIFSEFEDQSIFSVLGSGDVKYHMGYRSRRTTSTGAEVNVELAPNPSHLEFVNPVVEGIVRARQDLGDRERRAAVVPVLIHGDAAFIGQGVVWETLNMSAVPAYNTGGTFHLVLNNQVGFTTDSDDARSSPYCSDMAKAIQAPVLHVNAEDIETCCWAVDVAMEYRQTFGKDVVIDLFCYRKYGHNEGDDPSFTQPLVYAELSKRKSVTQLYAEELVAKGVITSTEFDSQLSEYSKRFQSERNKKNGSYGDACAVHGRLRVPTPPTGVKREVLSKIAQTLVEYPEGFVVHPKLHKILEKRVETLELGRGIEWGFAEGLAFGSLVLEGRQVRLSGQDCGRGTFSQRHLALSHFEKPGKYLPFSQLSVNGGRFEVYNSTLSEASVLGFEFGYSSIAKDSLVLWEAQFGDFANGAQVIIDQFIASSEAKWGQLSGLVLLLPHGFEGQGPEHSSARLERYLQLCGEGNMVVAYPSSAAQHFHLIRRQGLMELKRPLVVMTPKSLLRLPSACATVEQLTSGQFETVLEDNFGSGSPDKLVLCSGKVFYDIQAALQKEKASKVRVLRIEQLYPFPQFEMKRALKDIEPKRVVWVQEEPQNMGAWSYIEPYLRERLGLPVQYVGRAVGASPATGSGKRSAVEVQTFIAEMFQALQ